MADEQHLEWLREGTEAWNSRRKEHRFRPDLGGADLWGEDLGGANLGGANLGRANLGRANLGGAVLGEADLREANLVRADLGRAILRGADLGGANLGGADLGRANLGEADLGGVDVRSFDVADDRIVYSGAGTSDGSAPEYRTDLSTALNLTQGQLDTMHGDRWTKIPARLQRPARWLEEGGPDADHDGRIEPLPPKPPRIRFTPPAAFETREDRLHVEHFATRSEPQRASATPLDAAARERARHALADTANSVKNALATYRRQEDAASSNRVGPAGQMLRYAEKLEKALRAPEAEFLPMVLYDNIEILAASAEDFPALETSDASALPLLIRRGRGLYAQYPEIAEILDPTNQRFFPDELPLGTSELIARIEELVGSEAGREVFSENTRDLVATEAAAPVPPGADAERTRFARFAGIVGEMWREMSRYAALVQKGVNNTHSWIATYEKVLELWKILEPFIGG